MTRGPCISFCEIAERMGISRTTAKARVMDGAIPGGEMLYRYKSGRERWRVLRQPFEAWLQTKQSVQVDAVKEVA